MGRPGELVAMACASSSSNPATTLETAALFFWATTGYKWGGTANHLCDFAGEDAATPAWRSCNRSSAELQPQRQVREATSAATDNEDGRRGAATKERVTPRAR
ncbi:hypothetical protein TRIUR3_14548 [Triticum urartu]|uniref:Uncharacterized protein n=1 Tax=Triticum urartu TaxID=4572 RepID=M7ZN95_TRIUA|nr:hypothetical protein TRIUR3_14548 [Triticum urartu]